MFYTCPVLHMYSYMHASIWDHTVCVAEVHVELHSRFTLQPKMQMLIFLKRNEHTRVMSLEYAHVDCSIHKFSAIANSGLLSYSETFSP